MADQLPPILPYQTPAPNTPNFGMRAAKVSWLATIAAVLCLVISLAVLVAGDVYSLSVAFCVGAVVFWLIGLVSSVAALTTMRRYGRIGIRRPALAALCITVAVPLLLGLLALYILTHLRRFW